MQRVSDQLAELSRRAQAAEAAATAAKTESRQKLSKMVDQARDKAQRRADGLRADGDRVIKDADNLWSDVQTHWKDLVRTARTELRDAQADFDVARAQRRADRAEQSADLAVAFALAALEEAEYARSPRDRRACSGRQSPADAPSETRGRQAWPTRRPAAPVHSVHGLSRAER